MSNYQDNEFTELYQSIEDVIDKNIDILTEDQLKRFNEILAIVEEINFELNDPEEEESEEYLMNIDS